MVFSLKEDIISSLSEKETMNDERDASLRFAFSLFWPLAKRRQREAKPTVTFIIHR